MIRISEPAYTNIEPVIDQLKTLGRVKDPDAVVRLASSPFVLQEHIVKILVQLRDSRYPNLHFCVKLGAPFQFGELFKNNEIDLAMTTLTEPPPPGCRVRLLTRLKTVLLVPKHSKIRTASAIWKRKPQTQQLIGPFAHDAITRRFHRELARNHVIWKPDFEFNSIDLIEHFVSDGHGVGVSVVIPGRRFAPGVRVLPLPGFPTVDVGFIFPANLKVMPPASRDFMKIMRRRIKERARVSRNYG